MGITTCPHCDCDWDSEYLCPECALCSFCCECCFEDESLWDKQTESEKEKESDYDDVPFGLKIIVSKDVPKDEIWFIDANGNKHSIINIRK